MSSPRAAILDAAKQAVTTDRAATHGDAERTFGRIAGLWSVLLGIDVTPAQVSLLLASLKVARAWGNPGHEDNWVDLAGYAACGGELARVNAAAPPSPPDDVATLVVGGGILRAVIAPATRLGIYADFKSGLDDEEIARFWRVDVETVREMRQNDAWGPA